jgi:hypothetical protein
VKFGSLVSELSARQGHNCMGSLTVLPEADEWVQRDAAEEAQLRVAKGKIMSIEKRTDLSKAREALAASVFSALDRLKQYLDACRTESLSYEKITAASLELADAAREMDLRLRAVIRLQHPNAHRVGCCSYPPTSQTDNWPYVRNILNHLLQCSPCYEEHSARRLSEPLPPVAQDLLWTMLLPDRGARVFGT